MNCLTLLTGKKIGFIQGVDLSYLNEEQRSSGYSI